MLKKRGSLVSSDKMGLHFFELTKLPPDARRDNMLLLWLSLFKADTVEELEQIEALEVPIMNQAINAYYKITASSEFRERERLFEKARHDEAQALHHAEQKGRSEREREIAHKLKVIGMPPDQIMQVTKLTRAEIEAL